MNAPMDFSIIIQLSRLAKSFCHGRICAAGMTDTEHKICTFLLMHKDAYQDLIAQAMLMDKTTVAKAINGLEQRGLVIRVPNPDNRRKNSLSLTDAGREAICDIAGVYDDWFARVSACLSPEEFQQLVSCFLRMLDAARALDTSKGE